VAVVGELIDRVGEGRWSDLADLYAEDAVVEHPLRRTKIAGRTAIGERFAMLGTIELAAFDVVVHEMTDPEVVVAEYGYRGPGFTSANVQVVRVRDGLIAHSRDYHDHLRMAAARGDVTGIAVPSEPSDLSSAPAAAPTEEPPGSPKAVVRELLHSISCPNPATRADLYATDAYVTHPSTPQRRR
jgi:ketosteroid isomerase-like protein